MVINPWVHQKPATVVLRHGKGAQWSLTVPPTRARVPAYEVEVPGAIGCEAEGAQQAAAEHLEGVYGERPEISWLADRDGTFSGRVSHWHQP
jgi:hypothetical protein